MHPTNINTVSNQLHSYNVWCHTTIVFNLHFLKLKQLRDSNKLVRVDVTTVRMGELDLNFRVDISSSLVQLRCSSLFYTNGLTLQWNIVKRFIKFCKDKTWHSECNCFANVLTNS